MNLIPQDKLLLQNVCFPVLTACFKKILDTDWLSDHTVTFLPHCHATKGEEVLLSFFVTILKLMLTSVTKSLSCKST